MKILAGRTLTALAVIAMAVPAHVLADAAAPEKKVHDIRLTKTNDFTGLILTEKGRPISGIPVQVLSNSKVIAAVKTDEQGRYRVEGLRPGMHLVRTVKGQVTCRLWNAETAPPAARPALMMTAYTTVVRGQSCGDDGCGEPCVWNGCGEDCDGCGEGCCGSGGCLGGGLGIGSIVASPGALMAVAAFSAVSVVTVTSATNNSAQLGGATSPPPASP